MRKILFFSVALSAMSSSALTVTADSIGVQTLGEVVVSGEKPQVRGKNGVMTVDLPAIVRDKPVTNILEALGYLPGVTDNNGKIWLAGASDVTIILNGELTEMPLQNLYQLLYSTPVDRLKNVEIMYSAPANYHVNGAVINVVLRTPTPLDGLQGQARVGYGQAHYASYGGGLAATYATGDWTFDMNWGLSRTRSWSEEETISNHLHDGIRIQIEDNMRGMGRNIANTVFASIGWRGLKVTYNGQIISGGKGYRLSSGTLGDYANIYDYPSPINYHNLAMRYSSQSGLTVGGDYTRYSEYRSQSLYGEAGLLLGASNRQHIDRYHIYIDRSRPFGRWKLEYGAEYQHSDDRSSQHYRNGGMPDFDGTVTEDVASAYVGTQTSLECGLSFNISAKGEYYHNRVRHSWDFIPQFGATYYRTPQSIFQLNLSTGRVYPTYWELHGGTNYINDYSTVIGNPGLQPYIDYSAQASYILRQKYVATLYFQYGDKASVQLPYQSPDALKLVYQTINMDYKRVVGLNLHVPFSAGCLWDATATANIFNQREKADRFHDIGFDNARWIFYGSLANSFRLWRDCPVALSVDFSYISPSLQGIADLSAIWRIDAGLKWQFGKKRCCELDLKADDVFNRWSPVMTIKYGGQDYRMKVKDMTRNLKLTFVWRFNGFKPKDSETDMSRFGTAN